MNAGNGIKIMIVDDDQNILDGFRRVLSRSFPVTLCQDPMDALSRVDSEGPFAVVVSDMHMPGIDGINFLAKVREKSPDTVRMMLTGDADIRVAIDAVNEGQIFRFLSKPCDFKVFANSLLTGIQQYRLIISEKELLEKTLNGSISMLTEILAAADPKLFGMACKVRDFVKDMAPKLEIEGQLDLEFAALLAPLGWVTVPSELREKFQSGAPMSPEEKTVVSRVPNVSHSLLSRLPRLERVAELIRLSQCPVADAEGLAAVNKAQELLPGAMLLRVLSGLVQAESGKFSRSEAIELLRGNEKNYDQKLLTRVASLLGLASTPRGDSFYKRLEADIPDLKLGDRLVFNVETLDGRMLAVADTLVTPIIKERLLNFQALFGVKKPIVVKRR